MAEPQPGDVVARKYLVRATGLEPCSGEDANPVVLAPWTSRELREAYEELFARVERWEKVELELGVVRKTSHPVFDALARVRAAKEAQS